MGHAITTSSDAISIREVGPRDGLQNERVVPTAAKIELLNALSNTGLSRIEAVSFVSPAAIPQMADADQVWAGATRADTVRYSALVPNPRGAQRALAAGFSELEVVVSASETHNQRNINRSVGESLAGIADVVTLAHDAGATVEVIVATSFGCPYEGDIAPSAVARIVTTARSAGADRFAFGDTTGMATPRRVTDVLSAIDADTPGKLMHFHNTRGTALANVLTALDLGVTEFDASVGGLGGCPYAPGASGNLATEELVYMAEDMGIHTGVDLDKLITVAEFAQDLVGRRLDSGVLRAGPRTRLTPLEN